MSAIRHPLANGPGQSARSWNRPLLAEQPEFQYSQIPQFSEDLQVIDMAMPRLDGLSILSQLQSQLADIVFIDMSARDVAGAADLRPAESPELRWLREPKDAIDEYRGEWLLIVNDRLLAHSGNFGDIKEAISRNDVSSPFVYYVPTKDESNFEII